MNFLYFDSYSNLQIVMDRLKQLFLEPHKNSYLHSSNVEICEIINSLVVTSKSSNYYNHLHINRKNDVCNVINEILHFNELRSQWDDNLFNIIWEFTKFNTFTIESDVDRIECTRCNNKLSECPSLLIDGVFDESMIIDDPDFQNVLVLQPVIKHGIQIVDVNINVDLSMIIKPTNGTIDENDNEDSHEWSFSISDDDKIHPRTDICRIDGRGYIFLFEMEVYDFDQNFECNETIRFVCDVPNNKFVIILMNHEMTTVIIPFYYQVAIKYYLQFYSKDLDNVTISIDSN